MAFVTCAPCALPLPTFRALSSTQRPFFSRPSLPTFRRPLPLPLPLPIPHSRFPSTRACATSPPPPPPPSPPPSTADLRADLIATLSWVAVAGASAAGIFAWKGSEASLQFITAYIVEYSLSIDNLFVFLLLFRYFHVSRSSQSRVLSYGIAGAIFFRLIMIVTGEALTSQFRGVSLAFAAILIFSALKIIASQNDEDENEEENVGNSGVVKFASSLLPFSDSFDGDRFFTKVNGKSLATPLMLVLLSVEFSDVVFALDSVPAVLGISNDTFVIYLSNILAIAGLRNLFFLLADSIEGLRFLPQALALVLAFVGSKMAASLFGYEIGIVQSLCIVVAALAGGVSLSVLFPKLDDEDKAGKESVDN